MCELHFVETSCTWNSTGQKECKAITYPTCEVPLYSKVAQADVIKGDDAQTKLSEIAQPRLWALQQFSGAPAADSLSGKHTIESQNNIQEDAFPSGTHERE